MECRCSFGNYYLIREHTWVLNWFSLTRVEVVSSKQFTSLQQKIGGFHLFSLPRGEVSNPITITSFDSNSGSFIEFCSPEEKWFIQTIHFLPTANRGISSLLAYQSRTCSFGTSNSSSGCNYFKRNSILSIILLFPNCWSHSVISDWII